MGKYLIDEADVFRVKFEDGEWIDVKTELTQGDKDYIVNKMLKASASVAANDGKAKAEIDMDMGKLPLLERSIVAWSFAEGDKPLLITQENISRLRNKYRSIVLLEIDRLSQEADSFLKNSLKASI